MAAEPLPKAGAERASCTTQCWKAGVRKETGKATEFYPVVGTGTSGIGKSFFGVYAAYRSVLEKGITIIFTMYGVDHPIKLHHRTLASSHGVVPIW